MASHVGYFVFMEIASGMIIINNKEAISSLIFIRGI